MCVGVVLVECTKWRDDVSRIDDPLVSLEGRSRIGMRHKPFQLLARVKMGIQPPMVALLIEPMKGCIVFMNAGPAVYHVFPERDRS